MATTLRITGKGRGTGHFGVEPGGKVQIDLLPEGRASLQAAEPSGDIADFIGSLQQPGTRVLSIKEIEITASGGEVHLLSE